MVVPRIRSPFLNDARGLPYFNKVDDICASVRGGMDPTTNTNTKNSAIQSHAYRASMDDKDRLIHDLAAKMLKTRYSVERSNGYKAFKMKG